MDFMNPLYDIMENLQIKKQELQLEEIHKRKKIAFQRHLSKLILTAGDMLKLLSTEDDCCDDWVLFHREGY